MTEYIKLNSMTQSKLCYIYSLLKLRPAQLVKDI